MSAQTDPPLLEETRRRLEAARGHWQRVATESGVSFSTICKVGDGRVANPGVHTLWALHEALEPWSGAEG